MIRLAVALAVALAVVAPTVADAQPRPGRPRQGVDRREQIKKKIRALRAYTLTEELGLDEATAAKLFPILAKYDDELGKRVVLRAKLRADLDTAADDAAVDRIIDELVANQKALVDLDAQRFAELRKVLTPKQAGRLLVVLPALERKVQNMLDRAISGRRGRGRAAAPDAPFDDE